MWLPFRSCRPRAEQGPRPHRRQRNRVPFAAQPAPDIFATLEKLAELHGKGILSNEEFASKKAELLGRL
jgi:Short C-terminal domain